jgi:hypothetical protein
MITDDAYARIDKMWQDKQYEAIIGQLQMEADDLIAKYKDEIIDQGDWWWGTDTHSYNIHCLDDECDGWYNVNVYKVDPVTGMDNYEWMIDLPRVFIKGESK